MPTPTHSPDPKPAGMSVRSYWMLFFVALGIGLIPVGLIAFFRSEYLDLAALGVYCIPSNSIFPIPHEPGVLHIAAIYPPLPVAIVSTLGAGITCFSDYALVRGAIRHRRVRHIQSSRWFQTAVRWFLKQPFLTVAVFALTPLPVSVVRVLAPAAGYSVWRYLVAQMIGRFPRFYVLAWLGNFFAIPLWILIPAAISPLVMIVIASRDTSLPESDDLDATTVSQD